MKILLIFILILSSFAPLAQAKEMSLDQKAAQLEKLIKEFEGMCLGPQGEILEKTIVVDRSSVLNDGPVISCAEEAKRLAKMLEELEGKIELKKETTYVEKKKGEEYCPVLPSQAFMNSEGAKLLSNTKSITDKLAEGGQCKEQTGAECATDLACNIARTVVSRPALALKIFPEKYRPQVPKCIDNSQGDCVSEIVAGVLNDLWSNAEGVWELAKMAGRGAKNMVVGAWDWAFGIEDKTSDAALMASAQDEGMIDLFKKDPLGFIKQLGSDIWSMLTKSIYDNFGCEKWEGIPHASKCLQGMSNWGCASCNQKINAVCGVAGVLGGEVLVAYFTGGTITVAGKAGTKGVQALSKINEILVQAVPKIGSVEKGMALTAKVAVLPVVKGAELAMKVLTSATSRKILDFAKKSVSPLSNAALKLAKTKPLEVTIKVVKGATSPVTSYLKLLDKSFEAGMKGADKLLNKTPQMTKFSQAMQLNSKLDDTEELIVNTRQIDGISPEVVKAKLKEQNIPYEEVTLPDGTKAQKIKVNPSCSLSGKGSMLIK